MTKGRVTLRDIANVVGVTPAAVSLALRNSPKVSTATKEHIQRVAQEMGYRANLAGSLLRTQNPTVLGVACQLDQELHFRYHDLIIQAAQSRNYRVVVESISTTRNAQEALATLEELGSQAIIVIDSRTTAGADLSLVRVPLITVGQEAVTEDGCLIVADNRPGMAAAIRHLKELGHTHITYLDGPAGTSATARRQAIELESRRQGLALRIQPSGADLDAGYLAARGLKEYGTAIVGYNDQCAQGAMIALLQRGFRIPQDVSVVGFDNSTSAASPAFRLTSVDRDVERVAQIAVEQAIFHATGRPSGTAHHVSSSLVIRESTAAPKTP